MPRPLIIQADMIRSLCPRASWRTQAQLQHRAVFAKRGITTKKVTDDDVARLASQPLHPITLAALVKHGRPPLSASDLLSSANFTLSILPARLAHRVQSLRNLPYIVMSNPHIARIHGNYMHSLSTLLPWTEKRIESLEDEIHFTEVMADLVQTHANTISVLARGFLEARKYIAPKDVARFLDEHLRARIGTRLVAEQHIALHFSSKPHQELSETESNSSKSSNSNYSSSHSPPRPSPEEESSYIGVIDTHLRPEAIINHCAATVGEICELQYGVRPQIEIEGEPSYTFAHIPVHLEYIITELLKNAFRATIERGRERDPVQVTIAPLPTSEPNDNGNPKGLSTKAQGAEDDASHHISGNRGGTAGRTRPPDVQPFERSTPGVTIRIRDRGGGISPENFPRIWEYSFTTFNEEEASSLSGGGGLGMGTDALGAISADSGVAGAGGAGSGNSLAGLGYGLPLGRAYAEYFGGGIQVQSMWGWGTDVYLSLRGVGVGKVG